MLDDLTHEEWLDWFDYFTQDPWDEKRQDDRSAVNAVMSCAPYMEESAELPGFDGPGYSNSSEEDLSDSLKRIEATKQRYLSGELNRKTSNPTNG